MSAFEWTLHLQHLCSYLTVLLNSHLISHKPNVSTVKPENRDKIDSNQALDERKSGFIDKMKEKNRNVIVFYGSQTGTAEDYARRLSLEATNYGLQAMVADPDVCNMDELAQMKEISNSLAIFCVSTYWEGDPTDNALEFYNWLLRGQLLVSGLRYCVFGLGNSSYDNFNTMGKYLDKRLEELGAIRIHELGVGDTKHNIDEYFNRWKTNMWSSVCKQFNLKLVSRQKSRQYHLIVHNNIPDYQIFTGEVSQLHSLSSQRPPFTSKNPFLAKVLVNRELYKNDNRCCLHIELSLDRSNLSYEAGDYVAVYQKNDDTIVNTIGKLLKTNLDEVITLENMGYDSFKRHPFPCPTSYRTALQYYIDITSIPKINILKELSRFTDDDQHKCYLKKISSVTDEGKYLYREWIESKCRSIVDVLVDLPSVRPPLDILLELLPRLLPRYYTICCSSKLYPKTIHLVAMMVDKSPFRINKGVATNDFMTKKCMQNGDNISVPIFIRRSQFRLPAATEAPIIMIGTGSGVAPYRGFLQERAFLLNSGHNIGEAVLYFGCRNQSQDFLYEQEFDDWIKDNILTKIYTAFSRNDVNSCKQYVTDIMKQNLHEIGRMIVKNNGYVYVAGYAESLARDVKNVIIDAIVLFDSQTHEEAVDYLKVMEKERRYCSDVWS
ncbi:NADPH--cytochrome P450 reductase-like [Oppia nitens]|uniref:NADPH--cytochrome P450 reductase-like n=1 Tax=Oppia nitens TaxID=1686743 RepID=UPI0023DB711A|nr:NADPH--cytochrome P450 reductase-like [Oppia nitens]